MRWSWRKPQDECVQDSPALGGRAASSAFLHSVLHPLPLSMTTMGANFDTRSYPPPRKRARIEASDPSSSTQEPRLFAPFRALGLITNNVPFVLQTRSHKGATDGPRIHLVTCLGKAWAMWEGGKMGLLFVGE